MNLAFVTINPDSDYQDLETVANINFTEGNSYVLQVNGQVLVCEASSKPTNGGFYVIDQKPFKYTAGNGKLWVKTLQNSKVLINIAE